MIDAFSYACNYNRPENARWLLQIYPDIDLSESRIDYLFHTAMEHDYAEIVDILIEHTQESLVRYVRYQNEHYIVGRHCDLGHVLQIDETVVTYWCRHDARRTVREMLRWLSEDQ